MAHKNLQTPPTNPKEDLLAWRILSLGKIFNSSKKWRLSTREGNSGSLSRFPRAKRSLRDRRLSSWDSLFNGNVSISNECHPKCDQTNSAVLSVNKSNELRQTSHTKQATMLLSRCSCIDSPNIAIFLWDICHPKPHNNFLSFLISL